MSHFGLLSRAARAGMTARALVQDTQSVVESTRTTLRTVRVQRARRSGLRFMSEMVRERVLELQHAARLEKLQMQALVPEDVVLQRLVRPGHVAMELSV